MTLDPRGYVLNGDVGDDPLESVLAALGQVFTVIEERGAVGSGSRRRTWLDTFDWRLHNAGLVLEHEQTRRISRLVLSGRDGAWRAEQLAAGWQSRHPGLPDTLPAGPVRDAIVSLVTPRALLPTARAVSTRAVLRLLNADGKTVARLLVDRTAAAPAVRAAGPAQSPRDLPPRLSIAEVRGYPGQARRAATRVAAVAGTYPAESGDLGAVLSVLGRRPGEYSGKVMAKVAAMMPAPVAIATVLLSLLDTLEQNVDGVLHDIDTEFLHDLRVAVRRTRSAIKLLGDLLPADLAHYGDEFKWLGDMTTPVRDLDVQLLGFADLVASLRAATPADLEPFRVFLAARRTREFRRLSAVLRSARFRALTHDWRKALLEVRDAPVRRAKSVPSSAIVAADRTAKAYRKIVRRGSAITDESAPESLHDLRKRCKELRYLLEFFAPLYPSAAYRKVVGDLKKLQDCLGEFQDSQVQREEIAALADAMLTAQAAPAVTFLAMGEIAARLAVSQQEARADFAGRFVSFAGPAGQQRVRALLAGEAQEAQ